MDENKTKRLPLNQRGINFEMLMWIFTRVSALAMYALILFAIFGALFMGARYQMNLADLMRWGFMPNVTHVQNTNVPDVAPWVTPFWKLTAIALLGVAVAHGIHGLVVIADDYIPSPRGRQIVRVISILLVLLFVLTGIYVIWTS
jgi:succinate dehydrogenase hydrophobic anchor subunit